MKKSLAKKMIERIIIEKVENFAELTEAEKKFIRKEVAAEKKAIKRHKSTKAVPF